MDTKHIVLLLSALCGTPVLMAQHPGKTFTVEGTLCDSLTREAEPFATVRLLQAVGQKPLRVVTTQADGTFSISASKPGNYVLEFVVIGQAAASPFRRAYAEGSHVAGRHALYQGV